MTRLLAILSLLLTSLGHATSIEQEGAKSPISVEVQELIRWMESAGGFLDPRVEIRRWNPDDPTSYFGVFANAPIKKDEVLMRIPGKLKIQLVDDDEGEDWESYEHMICELGWMLKDEYDKGDESDYLPYVNYLKSQAHGQIPATWSSAGQELLLEVQGDLRITDNDGEADPEDMVKWLNDAISNECVRDGLTFHPIFLEIVVMRGFDSALIPVYDMINHYNGEKVNTLTKNSIYRAEGFEVLVRRDMEAGEELYFSYYGCPDCRDMGTKWGTPEMLRDFGFVEQYPQRFHVQEEVIIFVDEVTEESGEVTYFASCLDDDCPDKAFVEGQIEHLMNVTEHLYGSRWNDNPDVTERELTIIRDYHRALLIAFSSVLPKCPETPLPE